MPLLGLEPATAENKQENDEPVEDSNQSALLAPLLGTITSQQTETLGKSSQRRSPKLVCYGQLLQDDAPRHSPTDGETRRWEESHCYLAQRVRWEMSTWSNCNF